jgi:hypothetical protein
MAVRKLSETLVVVELVTIFSVTLSAPDLIANSERWLVSHYTELSVFNVTKVFGVKMLSALS